MSIFLGKIDGYGYVFLAICNQLLRFILMDGGGGRRVRDD